MRSTSASSRLKLLWLFPMLSATSACVPALTEAGAEVPSEFCRIARPITYDTEADTPETVKQIEAHNSQWACVCDADCPKQP